MTELTVNINSGANYPIHITNDDITNIKPAIEQHLNGENYIVVISKKVHSLYGRELGFSGDKTLILPDGEKEKNYKNYLRISEFALRHKLNRKDTIIAVGGGVVGDLAGFAASTYMRGINFIQVPTTLLAAVDSSVGGKTAINTKFGKNLIGTFHQPKAVFINVNFLETLDETQYKSGLGEVLKYGFIEKNCRPHTEAELLNFINVSTDRIKSRDIITLTRLIEMCLQLKIAIVEKDEKESGVRKILNFGHTYGHATETLTNYKKYTHGHCVVEGMRFAFDLSERLGKIDREYGFLCEDLISKFDYKRINGTNNDKIIKTMCLDKKADKDFINFILPTGFASAEEVTFSPEELKEFIANSQNKCQNSSKN